jgi:hypothetical protein
VICVPAELAASWRGTNPPIGVEVPDGWSWGSGDIECDYDRACDTDKLEDYAYTPSGGCGWLSVADGFALIFDCELHTAWLPDARGGYVIRNCESPLDEARARVYVGEAEQVGWRELSLDWQLAGQLHLFDSAYAGTADPDENRADDGVAVGKLEPGRYRVAVATTPDEIDVIRILRV